MISLRANIEEYKLPAYSLIDFRSLIIILLFLIFLPFSAVSQSRQELEKQRVKLQKEIKEINTLLFQSQKKEKTLLSQNSFIRY